MQLNERILQVLNDQDIKVIGTENGYTELEFCSNAGEDFIFYVYHDNTIAGFVEGAWKAYIDFEADEHVAELVPYREQGGAPSTVEGLLEDAIAIKVRLRDLYVAACYAKEHGEKE